MIGIVGHAGCGHANSHLGFIQDDSGGLSAVLGLLRDATGLSLEIVECSAHTGIDGAYFYVKTISGGEAKASARRGITAAEARLGFLLRRKAGSLFSSDSSGLFRENIRPRRHGSTCCIADCDCKWQRWTAL